MQCAVCLASQSMHAHVAVCRCACNDVSNVYNVMWCGVVKRRRLSSHRSSVRPPLLQLRRNGHQLVLALQLRSKQQRHLLRGGLCRVSCSVQPQLDELDSCRTVPSDPIAITATTSVATTTTPAIGIALSAVAVAVAVASSTAESYSKHRPGTRQPGVQPYIHCVQEQDGGGAGMPKGMRQRRRVCSMDLRDLQRRHPRARTMLYDPKSKP